MTLNTKLSVPLYTRMGIDVGVLKKQIAKHISRGIATSSLYAHIARNIDGASNIGFNKSMRLLELKDIESKFLALMMYSMQQSPKVVK